MSIKTILIAFILIVNLVNAQSDLEYKKEFYRADHQLAREIVYKGDTLIRVINYYKNGQVKREGSFKDGFFDGEWRTYNKKGDLIRTEQYKKGVLPNKDGEYLENPYQNIPNTKIRKTFYDGYLNELITYKGDKMVGLYQSFFESGFPNTIGYYDENGKQTGKWINYNDKSGDVYMITNYKKGNKHGEQISYSHNKVEWARIYDDDLEIESRAYYSNGNLQFIRKFQTIQYTDAGIPIFPKGERETGRWQYCASNGLISLSENWKNGEREGLTEVFYSTYEQDISFPQLVRKSPKTNDDNCNCLKNTHLKERGNFLYSYKDGIWTTYYKNGQTKTIEKYQFSEVAGKKKSTPIGEWKSYYENGELSSIGNYKKGKKKGKWFTYKHNGDYSYITYKKRGEKHGRTKAFYKNGKCKMKGKYKHNKKYGKWKYYHKDGSLEKTTMYTKRKPNLGLAY